MTNKREITKHDLDIIDFLRRNPQASLSQIAENCHLSISAVQRRVKHLENNKIIKKTTIIDQRKIGFPMLIWTEITFNEKNASKTQNLEDSLMKCEFTKSIFKLLGDSDFLVLFQTRDMQQYTEIIQKHFENMPIRYKSMFCLDILKECETFSIK